MTDEVDRLEKELEEARSKELRVVFYSPGTFFPESSSFEIKERSISWAIDKAKEIKERYDAKPHSFRFEDGNGKYLSGFHYLTGTLRTYDEVPDDKEHYMLRTNMLNNDIAVCVENRNSFRFTGNFYEEDCILDWDGNIVQRGNDENLMNYRDKFKKIVADYNEELARKYGQSERKGANAERGPKEAEPGNNTRKPTIV